jgi:hypothetical protein
MKTIIYLAVVFLTLIINPFTSNAFTNEVQSVKSFDTPYIIGIEYVYIDGVLFEITYYSDETITMNAVAISAD